MKKILAIKGHPTRCKEVIEILEMLGGNNANNCYGKYCDRVYYINENGYIDQDFTPHIEQDTKFIIFSLEEFLEKYPYNVGDKVNYVKYNDGYPSVYTIQGMRWTGATIEYLLDSSGFSALTKDLQPYKEETMEEIKYSELRMPLDDDDKLATEVTVDGNKILPPNGYLIGKITQVDNGILVEYVKKQPKYPKTYEECCKIIHSDPNFYIDTHLYSNKLELLYKLIICRDAYWKMSGNWSPDWQDSNFKYCIKSLGVDVVKGSEATICCILAFPTKEMRNAFYENFKELIELVKELL